MGLPPGGARNLQSSCYARGPRGRSRAVGDDTLPKASTLVVRTGRTKASPVLRFSLHLNLPSLPRPPPPRFSASLSSSSPFQNHFSLDSTLYSAMTTSSNVHSNEGLEANGEAAAPFKVFVGYDSREDVAFEVCRHSLLKHASVPVEVIPLKQSELRAARLYSRERDPTESTEFSFTRFLTPYLAGYRGWAMFVDCDFLYTADIKGLIDLADDRYAIMCVHHEYVPKDAVKMDGVVQIVYPRKNWSSMVLYNCGHPKNRVLTPELVSSQTGAFLHRFMWLDDSDVGSVPLVWNFLVGHNKVDDEDPETFPKAIHYTLGGPWFEAYKDCEFSDLWLKELEEVKKVAEI